MRSSTSNILCGALLLGSAAASPLVRYSCSSNATTGGRPHSGNTYPIGGSIVPPGQSTLISSAPAGQPTLSASIPAGQPTLSASVPVVQPTRSVSVPVGQPSLTLSFPVVQPTPTSGAVPVGRAITSCTVPGTVALTFDDGPFDYTNKAMNLLKAAGFRATFFLNGDNYVRYTATFSTSCQSY